MSKVEEELQKEGTQEEGHDGCNTLLTNYYHTIYFAIFNLDNT